MQTSCEDFKNPFKNQIIIRRWYGKLLRQGFKAKSHVRVFKKNKINKNKN